MDMLTAKKAAAEADRGALGFGGGVTYGSAPAGTQTYSANTLVSQ